MNNMYPDEVLEYMSDYFQMRKDLHGKVTLEQFLRAPVRYQWIPGISEEKEIECSY